MLNFLSGLAGGAAKEPIEAVGTVLDSLFTSDEEKLDKENAKLRLLQKPALVQAEINKVEAQHRSVFVAGWRPFIGWVCGFNLLYLAILRDFIMWLFAIMAPDIPAPPAIGLDITIEILIAMLGLSAFRTAEKIKGKAK